MEEIFCNLPRKGGSRTLKKNNDGSETVGVPGFGDCWLIYCLLRPHLRVTCVDVVHWPFFLAACLLRPHLCIPGKEDVQCSLAILPWCLPTRSSYCITCLHVVHWPFCLAARLLRPHLCFPCKEDVHWPFCLGACQIRPHTVSQVWMLFTGHSALLLDYSVLTFVSQVRRIFTGHSALLLTYSTRIFMTQVEIYVVTLDPQVYRDSPSGQRRPLLISLFISYSCVSQYLSYY